MVYADLASAASSRQMRLVVHVVSFLLACCPIVPVLSAVFSAAALSAAALARLVARSVLLQ